MSVPAAMPIARPGARPRAVHAPRRRPARGRALAGLVAVALGHLLLHHPASAAEQPTAIFHAHDLWYDHVRSFVCEVGRQGYSHVQIAPAQASHPAGEWWARYQPVDYRRIEGRGDEADLRALVDTAHGCGVKILADVVLNHMADLEQYRTLHFPTFGPADFHPACVIEPGDYEDPARRDRVLRCRLGTLPDLDQSRPGVQAVHRRHLEMLLALGVDGFRFDAAKHMPQAAVRRYLDVANTRDTWNYLEVIEDGGTRLEDYNPIAAVTDFRLHRTLREAFSYGGDLRTLRVPEALDDPRSVTFGRNHDTVPDINPRAVSPYDFAPDAHFATAYVLARERGTPLVLGDDNYRIPFIRHGVRFRRIMRDRGREGRDVREHVLAVVDSPTVLLMERGAEGLFVVNKGADPLDRPVLDLTLTRLEGCYRELRNGFPVAIERRADGRKYVTRWGTGRRGGILVHPRDALYLVREPWERCE
jgi:alpha-amylase